MPWINLRPVNTGGGLLVGNATGKVYASGQLTLSHATCAMLGEPDKLRVSYEPELRLIRLVPTTPDDKGGFSLAGGGNSPHRFSSRQMISSHPDMIGDYIAVKIAGGVELRKVDK